MAPLIEFPVELQRRIAEVIQVELERQLPALISRSVEPAMSLLIQQLMDRLTTSRSRGSSADPDVPVGGSGVGNNSGDGGDSGSSNIERRK